MHDEPHAPLKPSEGGGPLATAHYAKGGPSRSEDGGPLATGTRKVNLAPLPGSDSTQILPSCLSMMDLQMASPSPVPGALMEAWLLAR